MDFFTPGNILTVAICFVMVLLFRQLDKNNRSLEKVKKFGDRLKDELDAFVKERAAVLEEKSISLEVQQTKAVAAVKRLETIREDLDRRETDLLERTKAVESFGKQVERYDATVKQLIEMTTLVETNLSRIRGESDFADGLAKKLMASRRQLEEIEASIPALESRFADANRESLSKIHDDVLAATGASVSAMEARVNRAHAEGEAHLAKASEQLKDLYQKALHEAAKKADALEDAAFSKLREQANERLAKYKQAAEEKSVQLHESLKERIATVQQEIKTFQSQWRSEAQEFLEATRAEMRNLDAHTRDGIAAAEERLASMRSLAESRSEELDSAYRGLEQSLENSFSDLSASVEERIGSIDARSLESLEELSRNLERRLRETESASVSAVKELASDLDSKIAELDGRSGQSLGEIGRKVDGALAAAASAAAEEASRIEAEFGMRLSGVESDLIARVDELLAKSGASLEAAAAESNKTLAELKSATERSVAELARSAEESSREISERLGALAETLAEGLNGARSRTDDEIARIDGRLDVFARETEVRLGRFDGLIGDAERLDSALRSALEATERKVTGAFDEYAVSQEARQEEFSRRLNAASDTLAGRMQELESGLNELKARAYDNVSERLKIFEDDFFADLAKRNEEIGAALERWKEDVDGRLDSLANESGAEVKERLAAITEQYRAQTTRLEEQIVAVETTLRNRITASDQSILDFSNQLRSDFEEARKAADAGAQNEFQAHRLSVQELLRRQEQEIESRTREFAESIEASKNDAESQVASIRGEFAAWQQKNAQRLEEAQASLEERVDELRNSADSSIADVDTVWQTKFREYLTKADTEGQRVAERLASLDQAISEASGELERRSKDALAGFSRSYEAMTAETSKRIRETGAETDEQIRRITGSVQEIREQVEQTRERLMQKLQSETGSLAQTLEEIDKKQKAFIAQTRVFDRAEELRATLENGIESLKGELSRLDAYRETMSTLEQQYQKVRKMEEESSQKLARFLAEKKRIDILETDFTKLLGLSDSIDRKLSEFTSTDDDLQQWQVQLRRFEETVTEVNGRYDRLEKKSAVLDQTVSGVDKAFDSLKGLETALATYRKEMSAIPAELESAKKNMDILLAHRDKTESLLEKLTALDDVLSDVETRTEKMQTAREWLARTETRLEEISKQSQDQLKLLGAIMKEGGPATKSKGAPALGIRENVIKLAHQGWKVDEIARVFQLSRGEVELILELPQK